MDVSVYVKKTDEGSTETDENTGLKYMVGSGGSNGVERLEKRGQTETSSRKNKQQIEQGNR